MSNPLLQYFKALTDEQKVKFAAKAGSTVASIRLAAHAYKTKGVLAVTPELAARLEWASDGALTRCTLSKVCSECPHCSNCGPRA